MAAATAMLVAYVIITSGQDVATATIVVASRDIAPGDQLRATDMTTIAIDETSPLIERGYTDATVLADKAFALEWIRKGNVVHRDDVDATRPEASVDLAIPIESAWSLGENLSAGDRVNIYASESGNAIGTTTVIAREVLVLSIEESDVAGFASANQVTLRAPDEATSVAIIDAARAGTISLVRSSLKEISE